MCEFVISIVQNIQIHANEIKTYYTLIRIDMYEFLYFMVKNMKIRIHEIVTCQQKTYSYVQIRNFYFTKYTNSWK